MGSSWWQCTACLRAQEEDICELQLNHCNLYDVPPDVFIYERTLEMLYLDANRIKDLPRPLFQCHELRVLSLSDNEITTLPPAIASLINLESLDLSKNSIKELPDNIKECKNLRSIDLSVNPFERFPEAITHITGLRELYINDAYIEYLPANFGRLSALKTLELRENNMMTLPKSMSRLVNLQRLDIGNNDFTELPEVVGDLTNLTELWIDGNDIRRIPPNIEQLYRLNHFDCTMNSVDSVPAEIQGWRDISIINFSSNEILQLPDSLCYLRTIVTLKIDDNQLNSLPDDIGQMSSLEELIVTKNFLEYLPSSIGLLRKLHCLNADNNYLRSIPPELGSCSALSLLSLRSNNITSVPPEIGHLSSLCVLNLVNNCIQFLPVSMLNLNNLKALWLSDNQSQPLVPLQQEFNHEEDMMVLSCFMLPQKQRKELEQMEQAVGPISGSIVGTGRRICFATELETEVPRQLHRAPTPYPKELRNLARHARNLHHQSIHDQRIHMEREGMIKEAVVAKAVPMINSSINHNSYHENSYLVSRDQSNIQPNQIDGPSPDYSEESRPVLALEKSPEIREAKCIRNPQTNESLSRPPTIADYVSSTWKPEEYSRTNTAKIVESEKLAEAYKSPTDSNGIESLGKTGNEIPLAPPPYHIAAAFSKQAAFFQQLNRLNADADGRGIGGGGIGDCGRGGLIPYHNDNHLSNSFRSKDKRLMNMSSNSNNNDDVVDGSSSIIDTSSIINVNDQDNRNFIFREDKPSRIPIMRSIKNPDCSISLSDNDSVSINERNVYSSQDDYDRYRDKIQSDINTPTSPITGRKYRSPLSSGHNQLRHSDRSWRFNGNKDEMSPSPVTQQPPSQQTDMHVYTPSLDNSIELHSDKNNSGRSTPVSVSMSMSNNINYSLNNSGSDIYKSKSKTKWMFGQHKNVNVIPVKVKKNPGLGFSIAGGLAGNQTGIIVTKVNPDGPAQGTLRPGDKILEVDGIDFSNSDHDRAVAILRSTGDVVTMLISRHQ
ncbi:protein lap1 [Microplitis demolitor]|uniref:protein lap1 n=1 Tax=Microplitis demolitor TaxID=69319 RepID=UPI0004CDC324|nr:protein lap1 [Microplitis demolitor]XP_008544866.1 protein lap1 [Microplitis demolitor]XP_008544867.1 protein lap1 [Microplitis demolitor]XP_008544868.1 protein lap1 [Microplitis demolitor]XP_008544869.1 protein lap1 [Microplitis demolitor]